MISGLLGGLRVLDVSLLGAGALAQQLADLGADVVKVEAPSGDHVRASGSPMIDGVSLLHWHFNRGKRSIALNLRDPNDVERFLQLVAKADVLIEGMRPGGLDRRGLTWERLTDANPRLVMCSISGFGSVGPLGNMAMHGMGFDSWATTLAPAYDEADNPIFPDNIVTTGACVGPLWGAIGVLAGVIRARETGCPARMEVAQADAGAAAMSLPLEAMLRAQTMPRREPETPGPAVGLRDSVRYNFYRTADGIILVMMTERKFWENFCASIDRTDLFERWPGGLEPDHDFGNEALRRILRDIFSERSSEDWVGLGLSADFPIIQAHTKATLLADPHFKASMQWIPRDQHPLDMLAIPIRVHGEDAVHLRRAPTVGEQGRQILADWLGPQTGADQYEVSND